MNNTFDFGEALKALNSNEMVARSGWNGKGMFLFLIRGFNWDFVTDATEEAVNELDTLSFICMKTADNKLVPWLASQTDILASDWVIVESC